nr:hypothetical protein CFP56_13483 [Quercus suber]
MADTCSPSMKRCRRDAIVMNTPAHWDICQDKPRISMRLHRNRLEENASDYMLAVYVERSWNRVVVTLANPVGTAPRVTLLLWTSVFVAEVRCQAQIGAYSPYLHTTPGPSAARTRIFTSSTARRAHSHVWPIPVTRE